MPDRDRIKVESCLGMILERSGLVWQLYIYRAFRAGVACSQVDRTFRNFEETSPMAANSTTLRANRLCVELKQKPLA